MSFSSILLSVLPSGFLKGENHLLQVSSLTTSFPEVSLGVFAAADLAEVL
ncbi:unnamed protein product [Hymenolepis diminuta]|uniref:Uncharacterized protein n=1 Tax=Hymenolepis diminuta TaxID=6216 RepID=A0A564YPR6_HYMDI|nr:unnamed protein product [Hymenolepis diminuta]